ncbi:MULTISPECIES: metallophosphoesterase [Cyanophyceae]|uniref:metallophosphoesterase n=1 Tax=Cyanophyceae TaxID=3028117 RepID=UPI001686500C|nr:MULTISPECIES: metallophosphoesterase [Cyanophyceae]MBD1918628.1 metallophosphoesterase [Phormidium sp. FACHB-77]MBD2031105.1 metallophosphoesterase [Phormidium sp. FACHB-322]MBD2051091.1 metallophosphoesterase [Leptolyngbya sp. FACHB-60]
MRPLLTGPLTVETVTVSIRDLPQRLEGCRIVHLSDFHYDGQRLSPRLLQQAIDRVNDLAPDLIALTGDYVTRDPAPIFELVTYLSQLKSRFGTVAVLGNHDNVTRKGRKTILRALRQAGICALWNDIAYPLGDDLPVVGLADFWSQEFHPAPLLDSLSPTQPRLVLSHNPDTAEPLASWRVDLQLSGHTHGGQIVLPGIGPVSALMQSLQLSVLSKLPYFKRNRKHKRSKIVHHWEWVSGLHCVGQNQLYVNRGLGSYAPGRLGCPPEVTVVELVREMRETLCKGQA